jgi:hypothetical protein
MLTAASGGIGFAPVCVGARWHCGQVLVSKTSDIASGN